METEKEIQQWKDSAEVLLQDVKKMVVVDDLTYRSASSGAILLQDKIKSAESFFKPMVDAAYQAHKTVCNRRSQVIDPLNKAKDFIKSLMAEYDFKQKIKREAEERKARAEAEAKEAEKKAKLEAKAQLAEAQGDAAKAEALREKAEDVFVAPKQVAALAEKPQGVSNRVSYDVVILDQKLVPDEYKIVNEAALKRVALATKGKLVVPGVKFVEKVEVVIRSSQRKENY